MTTTVAEIILAARDRHPLLDERRHPDASCVRFLNQYHRGLCGEALQRLPDLFDTILTTVLPLADFDAGIAWSVERMLKGGRVTLANRPEITEDIEVIEPRLRNARVPFPSVYVLGANVYLTALEADWDRYGSLLLDYTATPTALSTLASAIALPDSAALPMTEFLVRFMVGRAPKDDRANLPSLDAATEWAVAAEQLFLREMSNRRTAVFFTMRDTES